MLRFGPIHAAPRESAAGRTESRATSGWTVRQEGHESSMAGITGVTELDTTTPISESA